MELVNGGELFRLIQEYGGLAPKLVQFFSAELILTMEHLHSLKIIYRDLKPENVILDCAGHVKLIDFGFAKELAKENNFRTSTSCGTLCYQAPEVILNKDYSFGVDWWGIGTLIFEMLTGKPPFGHDNSFQIQQRILSCSVMWPKKGSGRQVDATAKDLVKKFLVHNPDQRLGVGKKGVSATRNHAFFKDLNWEGILERSIRPPYKPRLNALDDLSYFPKYTEQLEESSVELSKKDKQAWAHELNMPASP